MSGFAPEDADGGVAGPSGASSTDNALVRWDGTTGLIIQNSTVTLTDNGNLTVTPTGSGNGINTAASIAGTHGISATGLNSASTFAVLGTSSGNDGQAVKGTNNGTTTGCGVIAENTGGGFCLRLASIAGASKAMVNVTTIPTATPSGAAVAGDLTAASTTSGAFWRSCVVAGTPGTWRGVGDHATTVVPRTTDYTVLITDCETRFTNGGASGQVIWTLPGAVAGLTYVWMVQAAQNVRIVAAAGDTIRNAALVSAAAGRADNTVVGSVIKLTAINATEWFAEHTIGTWTVT